MAQNSIQLPTTGTLAGLDAVNDINNANNTLATLFSGASAPSSPLAGQLWHDTTGNQVKIRSIDNTAWIVLFTLDESNYAALGKGGGSGYLAYSTATTLTMQPLYGNFVPVAGGFGSIGGGVTAGNSGVMVNGVTGQALAANTTYLVSLYLSGGVSKLAFWSTTGYTHGPDTAANNIGVEVIVPTTGGGVANTLHTLVGLVATNAAAQFYYMGVASWFNPRDKSATAAYQTTRSTASGSIVELNSEIRIPFVSFANRLIEFSLSGCGYITGGGTSTPISAICLDGAANSNIVAYGGIGQSPGLFIPASVVGRTILNADAAHFSTHAVWTSNGSTVAFQAWGQNAGSGFGVQYPGILNEVTIYG